MRKGDSILPVLVDVAGVVSDTNGQLLKKLLKKTV
jgi:hypothetical protein